jgi:hypothetical protein
MSVNCFPCPGDDPEMFGLSSRQRPTSAAKMLLARLDACNLILIFGRLSDICQAEVVQLPLVAHEETPQPGHHAEEGHRKKENDTASSAAKRDVEMERCD